MRIRFWIRPLVDSSECGNSIECGAVVGKFRGYQLDPYKMEFDRTVLTAAHPPTLARSEGENAPHFFHCFPLSPPFLLPYTHTASVCSSPLDLGYCNMRNEAIYHVLQILLFISVLNSYRKCYSKPGKVSIRVFEYVLFTLDNFSHFKHIVSTNRNHRWIALEILNKSMFFLVERSNTRFTPERKLTFWPNGLFVPNPFSREPLALSNN